MFDDHSILYPAEQEPPFIRRDQQATNASILSSWLKPANRAFDPTPIRVLSRSTAGVQHRFGYPGGEEPFVMNQTRWTNSANRAFVPTPTLVQSCTAADGAMGLRIMVSDSDPDEDVPHQEHVQPHPSTVYSNPVSVVTPLVPPDNTPEDYDPSIAATELPLLSYADSAVEDEFINRAFATEWSRINGDEVMSGDMNVGTRKGFPQRLFRMMEDIDKRECHLSHIVSWHHSGLYFVIHKPGAFMIEVLHLYFRDRTKLASFRRQLTNYGFLHRYQLKTKKDGRLMYYHRNFRRNKPLLLPYVVLKPPKTSKNTALSLSSEALLEMKQVKQARARLSVSQASLNSMDNITLYKPLAMGIFSRLEAARVNCFESNSTATAGQLFASLQQQRPTEEDTCPQSGIETDTVEARNIFPQRVYEMLEDIDKRETHLTNIISWLPCGLNFVIPKPDAFVSEVLPLYFRDQTKLESFRRQLNNYGFRRPPLSKRSDGCIYYHENFQRDQPLLLPHVVLKTAKPPRNTSLSLSHSAFLHMKKTSP